MDILKTNISYAKRPRKSYKPPMPKAEKVFLFVMGGLLAAVVIRWTIALMGGI